MYARFNGKKIAAKQIAFTIFSGYYGRSAEVRTLGLVVPNHARYQLRHTPIDIKMSYHILFYFSDIVNKNMIIKTNFLDLFFVNSHKKASCF